MTPPTLGERLKRPHGPARHSPYRDEGRPETTHVVLPIAATSRVLRARDLVSSRMRVFLLAHLEIVGEAIEPRAPIEAAPAPAARRPSPRELFAAVVEELQRCVIGSWGRPASENGRLRPGDADHARGAAAEGRSC